MAQADAICRKANTRLAKTHAKSRTAEGIAVAAVENEKIERTTVGELAKIKPPAELAAAWAKLLGIRRSLANRLGDFAAALRRGETKFPRLSKSKKQLRAELSAVGSHAGFEDCTKVGSH
jgi:hypothetical protein